MPPGLLRPAPAWVVPPRPPAKRQVSARAVMVVVARAVPKVVQEVAQGHRMADRPAVRAEVGPQLGRKDQRNPHRRGQVPPLLSSPPTSHRQTARPAEW